MTLMAWGKRIMSRKAKQMHTTDTSIALSKSLLAGINTNLQKLNEIHLAKVPDFLPQPYEVFGRESRCI